jgi:hypothetical protein
MQAALREIDQIAEICQNRADPRENGQQGDCSMKYVILLGDGMSDWPYRNWRTERHCRRRTHPIWTRLRVSARRVKR